MEEKTEVKREKPEGSEWMTISQAAKHLGVTRMTLYNAIRDGRLRTYTVLGVQALKDEEVDAFGKTLRPKEWRDKQREGKKGEVVDNGASEP